MQDFHADCTINLFLLAQGKPSRYAWVCSLTTREGVRLLTARRYLGIVHREEAEWAATLFGIQQTERLQQEKVQLSANYAVSLEPGSSGKHRDPAIQSKKAESEFIWSSFRLRKTVKLSAPEEEFLREQAMKAFNRKSRD